MPKVVKDLVGKTFNNLTVISFNKINKLRKLWNCKCVCGNILIKETGQLLSLKTNNCIKCRKERWHLKSYERIYNEYKDTAKTRTLLFELDLEFFKELIEQSCSYCGIKHSRHLKSKVHNYYFNGIDRIDNELGYIKSNCITCCKLCNKAKAALPAKEFTDWLDRISSFRK